MSKPTEIVSSNVRCLSVETKVTQDLKMSTIEPVSLRKPQRVSKYLL